MDDAERGLRVYQATMSDEDMRMLRILREEMPASLSPHSTPPPARPNPVPDGSRLISRDTLVEALGRLPLRL